jgi:hypothetical protein
MKWNAIFSNNDGSVRIPENWLFLHYYEALNVLFRIENALRLFAYAVLKDEFRNKWIDISIMSDDAAESSIGKIAKQRLNQTKRFGYLGYLVPCPLMYLTSGELVRLIVSDSYWKHFSAYFLGSKEIITNKLEEINSVRNALAHFRPIKQDDIELIKQNSRHVLSRVESSLIDMMNCANVVPTNTEEEWYNALKTLGTDLCRFSFKQSDDEKWVRVSFEYSCPILGQYGHKRFWRFRVLNINTPAILRSFTQLQAPMIYLSELISYASMEGDTPKFRKSIVMVFSRKVLLTEYETIKQQIENLLLRISKETSLLQDDNLARGELVHAVDAKAMQNTNGELNFWEIDTDGFVCSVQEDSPPEYWGQLMHPVDDYITSTDEYPWMPISVSEEVLPF